MCLTVVKALKYTQQLLNAFPSFQLHKETCLIITTISSLIFQISLPMFLRNRGTGSLSNPRLGPTWIQDGMSIISQAAFIFRLRSWQFLSCLAACCFAAQEP